MNDLRTDPMPTADAGPEAYPGLIREISPRDKMYRAAPDDYFRWGSESLQRVRLTLRKLGRTGAGRILDLPCGHGRELRFFKQAFPEAEITACDIDRAAVDFCAVTFGVRGVYSEREASRIRIAGKFDLIWCGSLLTHLDAPSWDGFLKFFGEHLTPNGVLIFTTHGPHMTEEFRRRRLDLSVGWRGRRRLLRTLRRVGFAYTDYTGHEGFGVSLSTPDWVRDRIRRAPDLELFEYVERGWFDYQDSVACVPPG